MHAVIRKYREDLTAVYAVLQRHVNALNKSATPTGEQIRKMLDAARVAWIVQHDFLCKCESQLLEDNSAPADVRKLLDERRADLTKQGHEIVAAMQRHGMKPDDDKHPEIPNDKDLPIGPGNATPLFDDGTIGGGVDHVGNPITPPKKWWEQHRAKGARDDNVRYPDTSKGERRPRLT